MADPVTDNYALALPTVGGDTDVWGTVLNNGDISPLDSILGANLPVTINASDVNLSVSQFQNAIFVLSGVLTGNRSLIVPFSQNSVSLACGGRFVVVNNTTGNFSVTVKTAAAGSVGVTVPQGFSAMLYSDKTNVGYATTGIPAFAAASNGNPNGQLAGTAGSVTTNASMAFDYANNLLYFCTATGTVSTAVWSQVNISVPRGFDTAVNLGLAVTHTGGNLLNVAVKTAAGADPTAGSPLLVDFQTVASGPKTTGVPTQVSIATALAMTTFALGATLGVPNNTPFRIWFALFNNAGTAVLAMRVCTVVAAGSVTLAPVAEYGVDSTVAISAAATSAGVWYTPNGTALTNCAYRLIGYCEYASGNTLATSGTYSADPSNTVLFGPGVHKPGDIVQTQRASTGVYALGTATIPHDNTKPQIGEGTQFMSKTITPTSSVNVLNVKAQGSFGENSNNYLAMALFQDSTPDCLACSYGAPTTGGVVLLNLDWYLQSLLIGVQSTFSIRAGTNGGDNVFFNGDTGTAGQSYGGALNSFLSINEIMA